MTKTTQDLAQRVLERLRIIPAGDTPSDADATSVKSFYATTLAEIDLRDLVYWDAEDIPDEAFEAVVDLISGRIAPDFGLTKPDLEASGFSRLSALSAQGGTGRIVAGTYF